VCLSWTQEGCGLRALSEHELGRVTKNHDEVGAISHICRRSSFQVGISDKRFLLYFRRRFAK
jgi:hypothetical protein